MDPESSIDPNLTVPDLLVLQDLLRDADRSKQDSKLANGERWTGTEQSVGNASDAFPSRKISIEMMNALNDPTSDGFEPTVFVSWDINRLKLQVPRLVSDYILQPYITCARKLVRVETDVVMLTHLLLYLCTSLPSALFLYYSFSWIHGVTHWLMQGYYVASYTLMMHQHIHMGGILAKRLSWIDCLFPHILNPLMGHTWNSYYYHHVKHHHVEGNGPGDLSTTIYYQRDELLELLRYLGRFILLVWLELPLYFARNGKLILGAKAGLWELSNYLSIYLLANLNFRATLFVFLLPLLVLRIALMVGNWGQHAIVDEHDPDSDFRSGITLIDVTSNRFCFNDGYHTSHHLNPRRHWRGHPVAFLKQKQRYSSERALVFRNINYFTLTITLLRKDYLHLAKCLVPMGDQVGMSLEQTAQMLRTKTRAFTEEDVRKGFGRRPS